MKLTAMSAVLVLFIADHADARVRRYVYPIYPYYPRVVVAPVAPIVIRPAPSLLNPALPAGSLYGGFIPGNASAAVPQMERYVRLENKTDEKLAVSLLYRTRDEQGRWVWLPDAPGGERVMNFTLGPGQVLDLTNKVSASRIRVWARSASRNWSDFQDKDLLLVPEPEGMYLTSRMETFSFTFDRK